MPNLQRLLRRQPDALEVDPELQARVMKRLASIGDPNAGDVVAPDDGPESGLPAEAEGGGEAVVNIPIWSASGDGERLETTEMSAPALGLDTAVTADAADAADIAAPETVALKAPPAAKRAPRNPKRPPTTARAVVACPYCASVLQPPPTASRRCPRCRQRIVVRRLADRAVYLTEAAVPVFEAERRRLTHADRWTRERDRWLGLAVAGGGAADRVARLAGEPIAEGVVTAARSLYMSTVDRSVRDARRDRHWEEAARLRFEQALALQRFAGSAVPPLEETVHLHRDGLAAMLHGIGEIAKSAELRAGNCCDACRADDGQIVRIAAELRSPRLPHAACPKGLCRCRWYLADRDRAIVATLLKRHGRSHRRTGG